LCFSLFAWFASLLFVFIQRFFRFPVLLFSFNFPPGCST
jgi:hypothetical protein